MDANRYNMLRLAICEMLRMGACGNVRWYSRMLIQLCGINVLPVAIATQIFCKNICP